MRKPRVVQKVEKIPFTKEGYESLKIEQVRLQEERKEAVKNLSHARSLGDLSENGLYTAAKARLRSIDSRLLRIKNLLKFGEVQDTPKGIVGIGSRVQVMVGEKSREFTIVGGYESDPSTGKISINSPIGSALSGREEGDSVEVQAPKGTIVYTIQKIL